LNKQKAFSELNPNIRRCPIKIQRVTAIKNNTKNAYLPRGQNSQDTPKIAQRRKEIHAIQQGHRLLDRQGVPHLQTPPLYASEQPAPAPLPNLAPIPPSSQGAAPAETPANAPTKPPPPVLAFNWEQIKTFKEKLQQEAIKTYSYYNKRWF